MITVADLLPWRKPPTVRTQPPPAKPEWEQIAIEIIDARRPAGLDPLVFGDWPGTYCRTPDD